MTGQNQALALVAGIVAVILFGGCAGGDRDAAPAPALVPSETAQPDTIDPAISSVLGKTLPAGSSGTLIAARDGELVYCAGFGMADREAGVPATCDTGYDVMSMTKQFTAAAIVKLEMMGKLAVEDRIGDFFPGVPRGKQDITVHELLTHTAGLPEQLGGDYQTLSREDLIAKALRSDLRSKPGAEYHYSNLGYSLLAAIIELASETGYEEFLDGHLFEPAGMTSTGHVRPEWGPGQVAVEYDARGRPQGRPFDHPWAADGPYWNLRGNGGLISTARDMFRWHLALEGDEVLDRGAKAKLFEPYVLEEPGGSSFYGYGWVIQDTDFGRVAAHDGGNLWSYGEMVRLLDEGDLIFWVTNQHKDVKARYNLSRMASSVTAGVAEQLLKN